MRKGKVKQIDKAIRSIPHMLYAARVYSPTHKMENGDRKFTGYKGDIQYFPVNHGRRARRAYQRGGALGLKFYAARMMAICKYLKQEEENDKGFFKSLARKVKSKISPSKNFYPYKLA